MLYDWSTPKSFNRSCHTSSCKSTFCSSGAMYSPLNLLTHMAECEPGVEAVYGLTELHGVPSEY